MNRYTLILSAVVLSALSLTSKADEPSDHAAAAARADAVAAQHRAMADQARASKDFGMAAHCQRAVAEARAQAAAERAQIPEQPLTAADHERLAAAADEKVKLHKLMLATSSVARDAGTASHCRQLVARYTADAAAHRAQATLAGGR